MKLYDYWRSSAAYRVRIGANLKGVRYDSISVNILPGADEQTDPAYTAINPQARVPALETEKGVLGQSLAILEWLEETFPSPSFYSGDSWTRARIRAFALAIACDIHPLNNLSVVAHLKTQFGADQSAIKAWSLHWIETGFMALERQLAQRPASPCAFGDAPTLADICLVPQCANARRLNMDFSPFPRLSAIDGHCRALPAFIAAAPENQASATSHT